MASLWQYSAVHNSVCKVIEEQILWEPDGVPHLVAKPGRSGARFPLRFAASEC